MTRKMYQKRKFVVLLLALFTVSQPVFAWWVDTPVNVPVWPSVEQLRSWCGLDLLKPEYVRPEGVGPVKFMRTDVPNAKVPSASGKYYSATIPYTVNLEERAKLFVDNYLCNIVVPNLMYEPYNRGYFDTTPPRLGLDCGSYLCAWGKYRESLPLMRIMSGSTKGLEIDAAWAKNILMNIGDDGLFYVPLVGRPYESVGSYPWLPLDSKPDFYTNLFIGQGRLLGALSAYYKMTGDKIWDKTAKGIVDGLNKLAIKMDGVAFFPQLYYIPGQKVTKEQIDKAVNDWKKIKQAGGQDTELMRKTQGEIAENNALWQTWIITGLAQYYKVSHYEPARELAIGLANYQRKCRYIEDWSSHWHCITLGIHALIELSEATGDKDMAEYAKKAYDFGKSGKTMVAFPSIGYFVNASNAAGAEGCTVGDMTAIAAKLAAMGMGDQYWEDVDR